MPALLTRMSILPNDPIAVSNDPSRRVEVVDPVAVGDGGTAARFDLHADLVGGVLLGSLAGERHADVVDHDARPLCREAARDRAADAASRSGHHCDPSVEQAHRATVGEPRRPSSGPVGARGSERAGTITGSREDPTSRVSGGSLACHHPSPSPRTSPSTSRSGKPEPARRDECARRFGPWRWKGPRPSRGAGPHPVRSAPAARSAGRGGRPRRGSRGPLASSHGSTAN